MKSLIALLVFICCGMTATGQWSIGPKISYGTITQGAEEIRIIPTSDVVPPQMSFLGGNSVKSVGFMLHNKIGPGFLQIEALGTEYSLAFSSQEYGRSVSGPTTYTEKHTILEIPVSAGISHKNFKLGVGPVLEMRLVKDSELVQLDRYEDTADKFNGGFQGLVGYSVGNIVIDLRYVYRFTGIVDGFAIGNDILKLNKSANRVSVSLGYTIDLSKEEVEVPVKEETLPLAY